MLPVSPAANAHSIIEDVHLTLNSITNAIESEKDVYR